MKATREIIKHATYAAERSVNSATKPPCPREKEGRNENFIKKFDDEERRPCRAQRAHCLFRI